MNVFEIYFRGIDRIVVKEFLKFLIQEDAYANFVIDMTHHRTAHAANMQLAPPISINCFVSSAFPWRTTITRNASYWCNLSFQWKNYACDKNLYRYEKDNS